jgi:hypothetical protein
MRYSSGTCSGITSPASPHRVFKADTVAVRDFETTGLSLNDNERAIEIGAVKARPPGTAPSLASCLYFFSSAVDESGLRKSTWQKLMTPGLSLLYLATGGAEKGVREV